jgi:hypothetical protein
MVVKILKFNLPRNIFYGKTQSFDPITNIRIANSIMTNHFYTSNF